MNRALKITSVLAAATLASAIIAMPAGAADFSCRDASNAAEHTICGDTKLSRLDDQMAVSYGLLWAASSTRSRITLRGEQHRFLATRNACGWSFKCIRGAYLDQISVLDAKLTETRGD